jgi:putative transposase
VDASRILATEADQGLAELFVRRGTPEHIRSDNGCPRDECLNTNLFFSIDDARRKLETWRADYNMVRPHSSLGDRSPSELPEVHRQEVPRAAILNH